MSRIPDLGSDLTKIPKVLAEYQDALEDFKVHLTFDGKTLGQANKENPGWHVYYDQKRMELKILVEFMEREIARVRGKLFKSYTETYNRDLSDRQKDKYIDNEPKYLSMHELYLEIKDVYGQYQAVCDAFTIRGYALNNITRARVAAVDDTEL